MQDFKRLEVWQLAHELNVKVYDVVQGFPREELYGLRAQTTRAAGSIAANIAEGCGRGTAKALAAFLDIAMGSATELECHLLRARDRGFVPPSEVDPFLAEVDRLERMLASLIRRVRAAPTRARSYSPPATNDQKPV